MTEAALAFLAVSVVVLVVALVIVQRESTRIIADVRRECDDRVQQETERLRDDRDAILDRLQARSLAELESVRQVREQGTQSAPPPAYDSDWEDPKFNNRQSAPVPEYEDV